MMSRDFLSVTKKLALVMCCLGLVASGFAQTSTAGHTAPTPARANSQLAQMPSSSLCAMIDCDKPPKPVIAGIDPASAVTPGGQVVVIGRNFNSNDGKMGHILIAIGSTSSAAGRIRIGGAPSFSQPYKEAYLTTMGWSDGHAYGQLPGPDDIYGVIDGGATIQVIRTDGAKSDPFPVKFTAAREKRVFLPTADMRMDSCSHDGDENQCNNWADYTSPYPVGPHTILGFHDKFLKNTGSPEASHDYYSFHLANGWAWSTGDVYSLVYQGCHPDVIGYRVFDYTSSDAKLDIDWTIDCSVMYTFDLYIYGPKGVPWK